MIGWLNKRSTGPLGIDLGGRSIKLVQFSADRQRILQTIRWELPNLTAGSDEAARLAQLRTTLCKGVEDHKLRGSEVVLCLTDRQLMVQNIRVPRQSPDMDRLVAQEIAGRIPL